MQVVNSKKRIWISGATGLIGSALTQELLKQGYLITSIARQEHSTQPYFDINQKIFNANGHQPADIIIHLAGKNIAESRWTIKNKQAFIDSRVASTELIANYIKQSDQPPSLFICASAIGFYGDRSDEVLDEGSSPSKEFISELAQRWEEAAQTACGKSTRVVNLRTGIVLSKNGGALGKMLSAFNLGLGGKMGNGKQYMSWITLHDYLKAVSFIIQQEKLNGPINLVSPNPVRNSMFSSQLASVLNRPCFMHLPSMVIKALFPEMGTALLLSSTRVTPEKLLSAGFKFEDTDLKLALQKILKNRG